MCRPWRPPARIGSPGPAWNLSGTGAWWHASRCGDRPARRGRPSANTTVMSTSVRIALIGDNNAAVKAHQAIPRALVLASQATGHGCEWEWFHMSTVAEDPSAQLAGLHGVWCVPASPYANTAGALAAIRFARLTARAFLGTCGGFQHALLEYAQAVWGVARPAHAELDPNAVDPVIAPLACSLVEQCGDIRIEPGSRLAGIYGAAAATEEYHCRYGLRSVTAADWRRGPLKVGARDAEGEVRAIELEGHPFFIATLFQPERSALADRPHPLVRAFVAAAHERAAV